jgi:hypothetical protein
MAMDGTSRGKLRLLLLLAVGVLLSAALTAVGATPAGSAPAKSQPRFTEAAAYDVSKPLRELAKTAATAAGQKDGQLRPERGRAVENVGYSGDPALQAAAAPLAVSAPIQNFEGLSNQDNFNFFGFRVNPPDPVGDVGPNHYVEMVNLMFAVYSKTGTRLLGPVDTGSLWAGFPIDECTEPSGDPIVIHDQFADRWILTQFTTRGINYPDEPLNLFYNCVAISTTSDPTGSYYRYAFTTGYNFPDYPKYGVWRDSYLITTREFGIQDETIYGIGVYGLERNKMIEGDPNARAGELPAQRGSRPAQSDR